VSKISEKLGRSTSDFHEYNHNGQIKDFLVELGLSSQFKSNPTAPGQKEVVQAVTELNHTTHFILIAFWTGYDDPKDNGYRMWAFPKSKFSLEQFMAFSRKILSSSGNRILETGIVRGQEIFPSN